MAITICPICDELISQPHDCLSSKLPSFSLELELLGISLELEPHYLSDDLDYSTASITPERNSERNSVFAKSLQMTSMPLFLRL